MSETIDQPKDERSGSTDCSSCPRCNYEIELDDSGVNGVCWRCGVLWQKPGHKSHRRALLQRNPLNHNVSDKLREALNLIGRYCELHLMDEWTIEIQQDNAEQRITLTNPRGDDISEWQYDANSPIVDCCDCSQEIENGGV